MAIKDLIFNLPRVPVDRVIGVIDGKITVPAGQTVTFSRDTEINDTTLIDGVFLVDGNDNNYININTSLNLTDTAAPFVLFIAWSETGKVSFNVTGVDSADHIVHYHIVLIAKRDQGSVDLLDNKYNVFLGSDTDYRKIYADEVIKVTVPPYTGTTWPTSTIVAHHTLGYSPAVRTYIEIENVLADFLGIQASSQPKDLGIHIYPDSEKITFVIFNRSETTPVSFNFHYRIYYDEH